MAGWSTQPQHRAHRIGRDPALSRVDVVHEPKGRDGSSRTHRDARGTESRIRCLAGRRCRRVRGMACSIPRSGSSGGRNRPCGREARSSDGSPIGRSPPTRFHRGSGGSGDSAPPAPEREGGHWRGGSRCAPRPVARGRDRESAELLRLPRQPAGTRRRELIVRRPRPGTSYSSENAASNAVSEAGKSIPCTNEHASSAPCSRSIPESSHSTESGPQ